MRMCRYCSAYTHHQCQICSVCAPRDPRVSAAIIQDLDEDLEPEPSRGRRQWWELDLAIELFLDLYIDAPLG